VSSFLRTPSIAIIIYCRTIDKFSAERTLELISMEYLKKGIVVKNRSFSKNTGEIGSIGTNILSAASFGISDSCCPYCCSGVQEASGTAISST
jgi:hypothetical protein